MYQYGHTGSIRGSLTDFREPSLLLGEGLSKVTTDPIIDP